MSQSVTLDGDVVDPQGTLSGGSRPQGNALLMEVAEIKEIQKELEQTEHELQNVQEKINQLQKVAHNYSQTKEQLDLCHHELKLVKGRLAQSSFEQNQQEIDELVKKVGKLSIVRCIYNLLNCFFYSFHRVPTSDHCKIKRNGQIGFGKSQGY